MTLIEAQQNAGQVLDAERTTPTVIYMSPAPFVNESAFLASALGRRGWHPRPVSEEPGYYVLKSRNYDLLNSFLEDLVPRDHPLFIAWLRKRVLEPNAFKVVGSDVLGAGNSSRTNSELPLISELLIRRGAAAGLIETLSDAPLRPALTRVLLHIEEMIALDYRLFSDKEYDALRSLVGSINRRLYELGKQPRISNTVESNYRHYVCAEGPMLCDSIAEQCKKAKYLRLAEQTALRASGRVEGIDALTPHQEDDDFDKLATQVRARTPKMELRNLVWTVCILLPRSTFGQSMSAIFAGRRIET